jgi:hypothetical protein
MGKLRLDSLTLAAIHDASSFWGHFRDIKNVKRTRVAFLFSFHPRINTTGKQPEGSQISYAVIKKLQVYLIRYFRLIIIKIPENS